MGRSFHAIPASSTALISTITQKTWSSKLFEVIGIVTLACVTFASLGISVWNLVDQQSRVELETEYISELERIQTNLTESGIRLLDFQKSVNDRIVTFERTIPTNTHNSELNKLEREIQMSTNNGISELERRIQISYISELERRTLMSKNNTISRLKRRIMELQKSVDELIDIFEFERRIQRYMNDSISELERKIQIQNESMMEFRQILQIQNDSIELERNNIMWVETSLEMFYKYIRIRFFRNFPLTNCSYVYQLIRTSGYYWLVPPRGNGSFIHVYCAFQRKCRCTAWPAWARVALLDMSDPNQVCPSNWTTISSPVRTCGRGKTAQGGCSSVFIPTHGLEYANVCGRMRAYQHGDTTAFSTLRYGLDNHYLSGVSLTHSSNGTRQHIWSFASARGEGSFYSPTICSCSGTGLWLYTTSFVVNDYFCDSGNEHSQINTTRFYSDDPLWDGQGCGQQSTCCQFNNPPWFCKSLPQTTTDDLEVRICKDAREQDIAIEQLELFIQDCRHTRLNC